MQSALRVPDLKDALERTGIILLLPLGVLVLALLGARGLAALPASLAGLRIHGPWAVLALGGAIAGAFRRGRAVFALAALGIAYAAFSLGWIGPLKSFPQRTVFAGVTLLVPFYLAVLAWLDERGVWNAHGANRALLLAALAALTGWLIVELKRATTNWLYAPLVPTHAALSPMPQLALVVMVVALAAILAAAVVRRSPVDAGLAVALVAFCLGCHRIAEPNQFAALVAGAGAIVTVAVLNDTFRMAFRDELTGLASRRALNETLPKLGNRYVVAMLDVDHFKQFNDTHGHDVGDQVLRMVATRIARAGGGKAFRYGGEEFTLLFPGQRLADALPHLEALRADIEGYRMTLRGSDRPAARRTGRKRRGARRGGKAMSVTISIGAAERTERASIPDEVIRAADKALYRAKQKGRNQVSR